MCKPRMTAAICLALGTAPVVMAAGYGSFETTLYGSLAQGVQYHSKADNNHGHTDYLNDHLRIGVKGAEALGGNNRLFFNLYLTSEEKQGRQRLEWRARGAYRRAGRFWQTDPGQTENRLENLYGQIRF